MKRILTLVALAVAVTGLVGASAGSASAAAAHTRPTPPHTAATPAQGATPNASVDSSFNFCNTTGGTIACFQAHLHFANHYAYYLSAIGLQDTLCDSRAVYADVWSQSKYFAEYSDTKGCSTDTYIAGPLSYSDSAGVQYVQIALYACNSVSCSSVAWSLRHYNPY
jgi:hypothetical protein